MNTTLSGIRVVELSTFIAVPACARFFADLGAEVVKIEGIKGVIRNTFGEINESFLDYVVRKYYDKYLED